MGTGEASFHWIRLTTPGLADPTAAIRPLATGGTGSAALGTIASTIHIGFRPVTNAIGTTWLRAKAVLADFAETIRSLDATLLWGTAHRTGLTTVQISLITIVDPIVATRRGATLQVANPTDTVLRADALLLWSTSHGASRTAIQIRLGAVQDPIVTTGGKTLALTAQAFETIAVVLATGARGTKLATRSAAIRTGFQTIVLTIIASCWCEQPTWAGADERQHQ